MPLTLTVTNYSFRDKLMDRLIRECTFTGPASYATGGVAIDNTADFGWGQTYTLQGLISNGTTYYGLFLDFATQYVIVVDLAAGTEVANGTNLSAFSGQIRASGR